MFGILFFTVLFFIALVSKIRMDIDNATIQKHKLNDPTCVEFGILPDRNGFIDRYTHHPVTIYIDKNGHKIKKDLKTGYEMDISKMSSIDKNRNNIKEAIEKAKNDPDFKGKYVKFGHWFGERDTMANGIYGETYVDIDDEKKIFVKRYFMIHIDNKSFTYEPYKLHCFFDSDYNAEFRYKNKTEEIVFSCLMDIDNAHIIGLTETAHQELKNNYFLKQDKMMMQRVTQSIYDFIMIFNKEQDNGGFYKIEEERIINRYSNKTEREKKYCSIKGHI